MRNFPYIITIASEKGGVGKTTLATNLAIYLAALREDLPVTILSFDNHFTVDKMFGLNGQQPNGTVHDLLMGKKPLDLTQTGQYGVNYIPSSTELSDIHERFKGPMTLARLFAESNIPGIIIIDTRPDLNILTQNALYAADRVLIPVKDMPSLENCKNIFALFDLHNMDKRTLALLPCLIDERIKFDSVFKDQKTLLRAFAANRGYRSMDCYISKSPKVESLNTNPDGRIYPILTHARGTDVHGQFAEIARDILNSIDKTDESRSCLYHKWLAEKESKKRESYQARLQGLTEHCLICGAHLQEKPEGREFYFETSDRAVRGFLHNDCFADMLCSTFYGLNDDSQAHNAAKWVLTEKARRSVSLFMPKYNGSEYTLDFRQYDNSGEQAFQKELELEGFAEGTFNGVNDRLFLLLNEALSGFEGKLREESWLAVHPVNPNHPEHILREDNYRRIHNFHQHIASTLAN